jgi:FkbM family methyltransferase
MIVYAPAPADSRWGTSEDSFLAEFFRDKNDGYFVDIGAHDGRSYSNTRPLWERGWSGLLVEPDPETFKKLDSNYPDKSRLTLLNVAVCLKNEPIEFTRHTDPERSGWHSLNPAWIATWEPGTAVKVTVNGVRFDSLPIARPIDFLSIDTEGYDLTILQSIPETIRPTLIMCEVDKHLAREMIEKEMERREYHFIWGTYLNSAYSATK